MLRGGVLRLMLRGGVLRLMLRGGVLWLIAYGASLKEDGTVGNEVGLRRAELALEPSSSTSCVS